MLSDIFDSFRELLRATITFISFDNFFDFFLDALNARWRENDEDVATSDAKNDDDEKTIFFDELFSLIADSASARAKQIFS